MIKIQFIYTALFLFIASWTSAQCSGGDIPCSFTQNADVTNITTAPFSIHCGTGPNSVFRAFTTEKDACIGPVGGVITDLDIGWQEIVGTVPPITINLYENTGGPFPAGMGTMTLLHTQDFDITGLPAPGVSNFPLSVAVPIPPGELVVEVFYDNTGIESPTGGTGFGLIYGSNPAAQTNTFWLNAPVCGGLFDIGADFPGVNFVLQANGCSLAPLDAPTVPTMGEWGLMIVGLLIVIFGVVYIREKQYILE